MVLSETGFEAGLASKMLHGPQRNGVRSHDSIKIVAWSWAKRGFDKVWVMKIAQGPRRNGVAGADEAGSEAR